MSIQELACCPRLGGRGRVLSLLLCAQLCVPAVAQVEFLVGVGTHFAQRGKESPGQAIPKIAYAGFNAIRDEVYWEHVETQRGKFRLPTYARDYPQRAFSYGLKLLLVLGYGNRWHDDGEKPETASAINAYGRYCGYIGKILGHQIWAVEVWNEWHGKVGGMAPGSPERYLPLAISCRNGMTGRAENSLPILYASTGMAEIRNGYLSRMLALLEKSMPSERLAVSIHPYMHCDKHATPELWYRRLEESLLTVQSALDKPIDWYITEMGWPTGTGKCGRSPKTVAAYALRTILLAKTIPGMKGFFWYQWRDEGTDPNRFQDGFGLTDKRGKAKPALVMLKEWLPFLKEATFLEWGSKGRGGRWRALFRWRGQSYRVSWLEGICNKETRTKAGCRPQREAACNERYCN